MRPGAKQSVVDQYFALRADLIAKLKRDASRELVPLQGGFDEKPEAWVFWSETFFEIIRPEEEEPTAFEGFPYPVDLQFMGYIKRSGDPEEGGKLYNAVAFLHAREGYLGSYLKKVLFPIGEYIPLESKVPVLRKWFPNWGSFSPGEEIRVFPHPDPDGPVFLVFCCYEGIFEFYTDRVLEQAEREYPGRDFVMVNPTSDFRFGKTRETIQHSMLNRFQAAKRGLPMVRANGYGYTEIIAPWGESLQRTERDKTEVLAGMLPVRKAVLRK